MTPVATLVITFKDTKTNLTKNIINKEWELYFGNT